MDRKAKIATEFGRKLQEARGGRRVAELAKKADISNAMWYAYERGEFPPNLSNVYDIRDALGCKLKDILPKL